MSVETLDLVAKGSEECSGADIYNIVNESSFVAIRNSRDSISNLDLIEAFNKFIEHRNSFRAEASRHQFMNGFRFA